MDKNLKRLGDKLNLYVDFLKNENKTMFAEIITIGDEILIGQIVDTNSAWMATQLNLNGIRIKQITSVSDERIHILNALKEAESRADIILITGGLGPTKDDITKNTLCEYFNSQLALNADALANVERIFAAHNRPVTDLNRKQAEIPSNATMLLNRNGTAPGMWFEEHGKVFVSMAGVPYEMKYLMEFEVLPRLQKHFNTPHIIHKTVLTQGIGESFLSEKIAGWEDALPTHLKLAYLPAPGKVRLRISGTGADEETLKRACDEEVEKLKILIPEFIYGYNEDTLEGIIGEHLRESGKTLSTAESCSGGYIAHLITSVAGSSDYFKGSIISYANEIKVKELHVAQSDIDTFGAVSQTVVEQMAVGIKKRFQTDYSIAISGIAGPGGGTLEKPVGTVWIAIATPTSVISQQFNFGDNRLRNIERASITALNLLRKHLS